MLGLLSVTSPSRANKWIHLSADCVQDGIKLERDGVRLGLSRKVRRKTSMNPERGGLQGGNNFVDCGQALIYSVTIYLHLILVHRVVATGHPGQPPSKMSRDDASSIEIP